MSKLYYNDQIETFSFVVCHSSQSQQPWWFPPGNIICKRNNGVMQWPCQWQCKLCNDQGNIDYGNDTLILTYTVTGIWVSSTWRISNTLKIYYSPNFNKPYIRPISAWLYRTDCHLCSFLVTYGFNGSRACFCAIEKKGNLQIWCTLDFVQFELECKAR